MKIISQRKKHFCCKKNIYIPIKIIELKKDILINLVSENFNRYIDEGEFLLELKHVIPVLNERHKCVKEDY